MKISQRKRQAYANTFFGEGRTSPHPEAEEVLKTLKRFCGVDRPGMVQNPITRMVDPLASMYLAGTKDVYAHIIKVLGYDEEAENDRPGYADRE